MKPIIRAQNISKRYRIGAQESSNLTLRDALAGVVKNPFARRRNASGETIWALQDINFEVRPGEVVGIIGHNGAGKSTLLKILSRITEPTTGRIDLYGRIVSLLEVGTGFHPELTGRENIYLNGAVLGMKREETARKFDEIIAFAEIEKFLDTPVKHYSSGMYTRLAFAVAAHLEPEILIIDEVLAVGDAAFQRKCMDKMQNVGDEGHTVLFVSHNMHAIARLCPRTIMLGGGRIVQDGPTHRVIGGYLNADADTPAMREWPESASAPGDNWARLRGVRVRTEGAKVVDLVDIRKPVIIDIEYDVLRPGRRLSGCIICTNEEDVCVLSSADLTPQSLAQQDTDFTGRRVTSCTIPGNFLAEGMFSITVAVYAIEAGSQLHIHLPDAVGFRVVDPIEGDTARGTFTGPYAGVVRPFLNWTTESVKSDTPVGA
jgi:lipopolysaccharide transport system ATP-binding protein